MGVLTVAVEPYGLDPRFERAFCAALAADPTVWVKVGRVLEVDAFSGGDNDPPRLVVRAVRSFAEDGGKPPGSAVAVVQRIRSWVHDGKVTWDQLEAVGDFLSPPEGEEVPADIAVAEISATIKKRMTKSIAKGSIDLLKNPDTKKLRRQLDVVESIGVVPEQVTHVLGKESFGRILAELSVPRVPVGIPTLDSCLGGGLTVGALSFVMAATGRGKSHFLTHASAASILGKRNVAMATVKELSSALQESRLMANLTGIPTDSIEASSDSQRIAMERFTALKDAGSGDFVVSYFADPTLSDLTSWFDGLEQTHGKKFHVFVIDYLDKVRADALNDYNAMKLVYEGMREYGISKNVVILTASQPQRSREKKTILDTDDASDSMHKSRAADTIITINPTGVNTVTLRVCKSRRSVLTNVENIRTDFSRSRFWTPQAGDSAPLSLEDVDWTVGFNTHLLPGGRTP